jgi:hypothetical protein
MDRPVSSLLEWTSMSKLMARILSSLLDIILCICSLGLISMKWNHRHALSKCCFKTSAFFTLGNCAQSLSPCL